MTHALLHMNWLAILAASLAHFVLAGLWFAGLFAKPYARSLGLTGAPKPGALTLAGPFVCSAVNIATTAFLLRALTITAVGDALLLGAIVGVGYLAAMTVNIAINPLFPRPFAYAAISAPVFVIGSMMSAVIVAVMG